MRVTDGQVIEIIHREKRASSNTFRNVPGAYLSSIGVAAALQDLTN